MIKQNAIGILVLVLTVGCFFFRPAAAAPAAFAYVNENHIITAEAAGSHAFVVNIFNLSDYVMVIQPAEFIYRGVSGRWYIGQVFERESKDLLGEPQRYTASFLLKGHTFAGLNIVGVFHEQDQIEEISIRIGSRRYFMQHLDGVAFEQLAKKIQNIDLKNPEPAPMLEAANIQSMGTMKVADGGTDWNQDWLGLITEDGINPPQMLERPEILPTPESKKSHTYGTVRLACVINKNGGIRDIKVVKGLGKGLDERAMDGVKNSWKFLPATKNGELFETRITIDVEFPDPGKQ